MIKKYGNVRELAGMPDAKRTRPSIMFKPRTKKQKIIPYDKTKALQLMSKRGDLPPLYESVDAITEIPSGSIKRNKLVMKPRNIKEMMDATRNDEG